MDGLDAGVVPKEREMHEGLSLFLFTFHSCCQAWHLFSRTMSVCLCVVLTCVCAVCLKFLDLLLRLLALLVDEDLDLQVLELLGKVNFAEFLVSTP